jgi:hypothetical protein
MAILQALLSLITRSAGRILNAIFGWAVRALFGQPSEKEQPFLTGVVAAAAAWPVLLFGVAFPKIAAMVIAFVPFHNRVPPWVIRIVWATLAVIVPMVVGLAVAAKAPVGTIREPAWKRVVRGWPITIGLAGAFLIMFVTVPVLKVSSMLRRRRDEQVPLVTNASIYHDVAAQVVAALDRHGFKLESREPGWWVSAPTTILLKMGGAAFRGYVPDKLEYFVEKNNKKGLETALYPNGLLLRGDKNAVTRAHGIVSEALSHSEALQTMDPQAQKIEQRIHGLWAQFDRDPIGNRDGQDFHAAIKRIADELSQSFIPFEDWQIVYRELLQLERELHHEAQLIDRQEVMPYARKHREVMEQREAMEHRDQ